MNQTQTSSNDGATYVSTPGTKNFSIRFDGGGSPDFKFNIPNGTSTAYSGTIAPNSTSLLFFNCDGSSFLGRYNIDPTWCAANLSATTPSVQPGEIIPGISSIALSGNSCKSGASQAILTSSSNATWYESAAPQTSVFAGTSFSANAGMYFASITGSCSGQTRFLVKVVNDISPIVSRNMSGAQKCTNGPSANMSVEEGAQTYTWAPYSVSDLVNNYQLQSGATSSQIYSVSSGGSCVTTETIFCSVNQWQTADKSLWMKDFIADAGTTHTNSFCFYSPDIWLSATEGGTSIDDGTYIGPITPHYLNVLVRNSTTVAASGILKVYWAKAGIAQSWPNDWNNNTFTTTASSSSVCAGDMVGYPVFITVPSNTTSVFSVPWVVPNPAWFSDFVSGDLFHFCVVATIETGCTTLPSSTYLTANVQQSNKFSWKNFDLSVDWFIPKPKPIVVGNIFQDQNSNSYIMIKSNGNDASDDLLEYADVKLAMKQDLWDLWDAGGSEGSGTAPDSVLRIRMTETVATITNLDFEPAQKTSAFLSVHFKKQAPQTSNFSIDVMQFEEHGAVDSLVGGIHYEIEPPSCPSVVLSGTTIVLDPGCTATVQVVSPDPYTTYNWYDENGDLYQTGTELSASTLQDTYFVLKSAANGCVVSDTARITMSESAGCVGRVKAGVFEVGGRVSNGFWVRPNPAASEAFLSFRLENETNAKFVLTTVQGREIYGQKIEPGNSEVRIDCSSLPAGVYFVTLWNEEWKLGTRKLVIAR